MSERIPCEFFLVRYVPDPVKGEFINIGVILRVAGREETTQVRVTRDWSRVLCLDPNADTDLLAALEADLAASFHETRPGSESAMEMLEDSLSTTVHLSEHRSVLAESVSAELEDLMRLYVDTVSE